VLWRALSVVVLCFGSINVSLLPEGERANGRPKLGSATGLRVGSAWIDLMGAKRVLVRAKKRMRTSRRVGILNYSMDPMIAGRNGCMQLVRELDCGDEVAVLK